MYYQFSRKREQHLFISKQPWTGPFPTINLSSDIVSIFFESSFTATWHGASRGKLIYELEISFQKMLLLPVMHVPRFPETRFLVIDKSKGRKTRTITTPRGGSAIRQENRISWMVYFLCLKIAVFSYWSLVTVTRVAKLWSGLVLWDDCSCFPAKNISALLPYVRQRPSPFLQQTQGSLGCVRQFNSIQFS